MNKDLDMITVWLNVSTTINSLNELNKIHERFDINEKIISFNRLLDQYVFQKHTSIACLNTNLAFVSHCLKTEIKEDYYLLNMIESSILSDKTSRAIQKVYDENQALPSFLKFTLNNMLKLDEFSASYFLDVPNTYVKIYKLHTSFPQQIWLSIPIVLLGTEEHITQFKKQYLDNNIEVFNKEFNNKFNELFELHESTLIHNITDSYNLFETMYESDKQCLFDAVEDKRKNKKSYFFDYEDIRIIVHDEKVYIPFMTFDNFNTRNNVHSSSYAEYILTFNETKEYLAKHQIVPYILHYAPSLYGQTYNEMDTVYPVLAILEQNNTMFFTEQKVFSHEIYNKIVISQFICGIPLYKLQFFAETEFNRKLCKEKVLYFIKKESLFDQSVKQLVLELLMNEEPNCELVMITDKIPLASRQQSMFD